MKPTTIPVTAIRFTGPLQSVTAAEAKAMPPGRRYRWRQPIEYVLSDGTTFPGAQRAMSRPKLDESIQSTRDCVARGMYVLERHADGRAAIILSVWIGPAKA